MVKCKLKNKYNIVYVDPNKGDLIYCIDDDGAKNIHKISYNDVRGKERPKYLLRSN